MTDNSHNPQEDWTSSEAENQQLAGDISSGENPVEETHEAEPENVVTDNTETETTISESEESPDESTEEPMADEIESGNQAGAEVFNELDGGDKSQPQDKDLEFIKDIPVQLSVEIGRTKIQIKTLLQLSQGSIVELDAASGDLMDILVNGTMIAKGEVVVINEKFGVRLTEIITPIERIRKLNK